MKQLFPKEIVEHTTEVHQFEHRNQSKVIYGVILMAIIITLVALPFIKISVYSTARGILKPSKERVNIVAQQSGKVSFVHISDNQVVKTGDTLLTMSTSLLDNQIEVSDKHIHELEQFNADASYLLETKKVRSSSLQSARYQKEYSYYQQKLQELQTRLHNAKRTYNRNNTLFKKGVIAKVALENSAFEYQVTKSEYYQYKKQQRTAWQTALTETKQQILDLYSKRSKLYEEEKQFVLLATMDGVLKNVQGITIGSFITAGSSIAEISPDTELIAECYVYPTDIGLVGTHTPVQLQIDAFNYNQWGLASAQITEISKDIDMRHEQPIFKVRCELPQNYLTLANGFQGYLKKGMTFNARFELTERTLWQLLYDKADDWFNPATTEIAER